MSAAAASGLYHCPPEAGLKDAAASRSWGDSALFASAGIPTVLFGPHGEGAHAAVEWVDLASVDRCRDVYLGVASDFCA